MTDEALMTAVRNGDLAKLGLLFERYHVALFDFLSRMTGDRTAAEDLVQDIFVRILKYRAAYRDGGSFETWLFRIARNARADYFRTRKSLEPLAAEAMERPEPGPGPMRRLEADRERVRLKQALLQLREDKRELIVLARYRGMTHEQIAELLGIETGTSGQTMNRGSTDFTIQVPAKTHLKLSTLNDGPIVVENVEGEIEVNNQNESITLTNVAGSVVANAHNGRVKVVMTRLTADKAMGFTSFNGNVDVTLPASAKANLKMRSDMGEIFTAFDVQIRPAASPAPQSGPRGGVGFRLDVNQSIQGSVNGGGPEFELRTFNGNIYLRKGAQ